MEPLDGRRPIASLVKRRDRNDLSVHGRSLLAVEPGRTEVLDRRSTDSDGASASPRSGRDGDPGPSFLSETISRVWHQLQPTGAVLPKLAFRLLSRSPCLFS